MSDSLTQLVDIGKRNRLRQDKVAGEERAHEKEITQMGLQAEAQEKEKEAVRLEASKQKDRENKIEVEEIKALGRASDKESDQQGFDEIKAAADIALAGKAQADQTALKSRELDIKEQAAQTSDQGKQIELKIQIAARKDANFRAVINKN